MRSRAFKLGRIAAFYLALLALWQLLASSGIWKSYVFPPPKDVFDSLRAAYESGRLVDGIETTMRRMALGYTISICVGLTVGVFMGSFKWVDETVGSLVLGIQSLPSVTWFPLAILWFGLNEHAITFVVLMGSVGSIAISARAGVHGIPRIQLRAARMLGGRWWQLYLHVVLPGMLPSLVQGLKLGWSFAWRSLLAAELLFVSASLGNLLNMGRDLNDVSLVIAVMFVIVAIGITMDRLLFGTLERAVSNRWGLNAG